MISYENLEHFGIKIANFLNFCKTITIAGKLGEAVALRYTPYSVPLFTTGIISIILAIYGWRRRQALGAIPFILLVLFVAQWSLSYGFELGSIDLEMKEFWAKIEYLGIVTLPVAWLLFALKYTGRDEWLKFHKIVLIEAGMGIDNRFAPTAHLSA